MKLNIINFFLSLNAVKRASILLAGASLAFLLLVSSQETGPRFACVNRDNGSDTVLVRRDSDNTVWAIAENHCTGDLSQAQDRLVEVYGVEIYPGQMINLP